jgi:ribonuclease HI
MTEPWVIYCDGSAIPNPGRIGLGAVLNAPDGTRHTLSVPTHMTGCNNEAELRALIAAMQDLQARQAKALLIHTDSSIVVEQLGSADAKPITRLSALFDEARELMASFEQVRLQWIPQHRNGEADALARAALGLPPRLPAKPAKRRR